MAQELYRTYEVLIEETVSLDDPRRGKTNKSSRYSAEIAAGLRDTNDIYQDAVCYYTLLLAGLVGDGDEGAGLNPLWRHLRCKGMRAQTDAVVKRLASRYSTLAGLNKAEEFLDRVYGVLQREHLLPGAQEMAEDSLQAAMRRCRAETYRIIENQGTERDETTGEPKECQKLNVFASSWASILCDPTGDTDIPGNGVYDRVHRRLKVDGLTNEQMSAILDEEIAASEQCHATDFEAEFGKGLARLKSDKAKARKTAKRAEEHQKFIRERRAQSRKNIIAAFDAGFYASAKDLGLTKEEYTAKESTLKTLAPTDATPLDDPRFRRLRYGARDNSFEKPFFRLLWLRNNPEWAPLVWADFRCYLEKEEPLPEPRLDDKQVREMPYARLSKTLFPLFVKPILGVASKERSAWWEFDVSAFAAAAEDVFKYKIRTLDREKRYAKLDLARQAFLGTLDVTLSKADSPTGNPMKIRGMGDDPRRPVMERLLESLAEKFEFEEYGLRSATIGGWADLRKAFRQREREAEKHGWTEATLVEKLEDEVEKAQGNNSDGFGSAAFFNNLCEPQHHCLWSAKPRFPHAEGQVRDEHARNFVRHYVRYSSLLEDIRALEEKEEETGQTRRAPIRFTWPGTLNRYGETSYRHFDFKAPLNRSLALTLFRRLPGADGQPARYELREDYAVTLAARRLKRDRVMTAAGNTVDAVWCPPLVLAETPPKVGKRSKNKKQGKDQDISFSLMVSASGEDGSPPPVYLKVAVPVAFSELKKLKQTSIGWEQGSLRGHRDGDDKRSYFRWPADLKTEALAKIAAGESGNGQSKKAEEAVTAAKLWCGDGAKCSDSFRVKDGKVSEFHVLSVDLNVRFAAAFARLRVFINDGTLTSGELAKTRRLSSDDFATDIRAHAYRRGTMRLSGEDAKLWQKAESGAFEFVEEPFGSKGRLPSPEERAAFTALADALVPTVSFPLRNLEGMSIAEMGDALVRRLRRRLSRIKFLFKLRWQASGRKERNPDTHKYDKPRSTERQAAHHRAVAELLGKLAFPKQPRPDEAEHPDNRRLRDALRQDEQSWKGIREDLEAKKDEAGETARRQRLDSVIANWDWVALTKEVQAQLHAMFVPTGNAKATTEMLAAVANHCLPLRGRVWCWRNHELDMTGKPEHKPLIRGMRGLSIRRIEQVSNLRQSCQSLAKLEKRYCQREAGIEPTPTSRGDIVDDPCPELLAKRNELREQRVNQTAHMILAEALGLKLKNPAEVQIDGLNKPALKSERDLHGQYEPMLDSAGQPLPRCSVIVMEDLSRYRTSQDRSRGENTQLMNWCHRAVVEKLQDIAKPFGITHVLVDAAYSSRFHSLSGLPGVRVEEASRQKLQEMPFVAWAEEKKKARGNNPPEPTDRAKWVQELRTLFEEHKAFNDTLLMPVEGGKGFISVPAAHGVLNGLLNADENAAINIGLRALAHPDRLDVFHRIQTEAESEAVLKVRNRRGFFAELDAGDSRRVAQCQPKPQAANNDPAKPEDDDEADDEATESAARPNLFFIPNRCLPFGPESLFLNARFEATRYGPYWGQTKSLCEKRIRELNADRLAKGGG